MDSVPTTNRRSPAMLLGAVMRRLVGKAWTTSFTYPARAIAVNFVVIIGAAVALGVSVHSNPGRVTWDTLFILATLAIVGTLLRVPTTVQRSASTECSHIFCAIAFASLDVPSAVTFVLIVGVLGSLIGMSRWIGAYSGLTLWMLYGACGVAVVAVADACSAHGAIRTVIVVGGWLMVSASLNFAWMMVLEFIDSDESARQRVKTIYEQYAAPAREIATSYPSDASIAVLGAAAWYQSAWFAIPVFAPYLLSYRHNLQAAKLADVERKIGVDALTGLSNRARFFEVAERELGSATRYGHRVALVMGDLDNFKRINDSMGHVSGDEALRRTAKQMRMVADEERFEVARYGGEEFVMIVPAAERDSVLAHAERIRVAVYGALHEDFGSSISLGVAFAEDSDTVESLVERADHALYAAKFSGKNRICEWDADASNGLDVAQAA